MEKVDFYLLSKYIIALILCGFCSIARAEGIDMGPCKLYPIIKVEERFEDNIFQLAGDAKSDFVTTTTPELLLKFKCNGENIWYIDYKYEMLHFDRYHNDDRQNHKFNTTLELHGKMHFLRLKEDFQQVTTTSTAKEYFDNYDMNTASITVGKEFNNSSLEATYENLNYEYQAIDSQNSYNEHIFDVVGYYKIFPKTKALLEYDFGKLSYDNDATKDGDYNEFLWGVKGELSEKTTGTAKMGYQSRDYKSKNDWREPVVYADIAWEISKKTSLTTTLERKPLESISTTENFYETNKFGCKLSEELTPKTILAFDVSYNYDKYPITSSTSTRRKDDTWDAKVSLDVKTRRWLSSGLSYEFKKRNSNISTNDYENNIASVYLKAMY